MGTKATKRKDGYIDHPDYSRPDAAQELFGEPLPALPPAVHLEADDYKHKPKAPALSRDEEGFRFRQYNYARKRAAGAVNGDVALWAGRAGHLREYLIRSNMALVPSTINGRRNYGDLDAAYSEGLAALLRAVDSFDVGRGWKFSTFACQCIINALGAAYEKATLRARRLPTSELTLAAEGYIARDPATDAELADDVAILREALAANTAGLTPTEQHVIEHRFLTSPKETLHVIGSRIGCSKERVRQIEVGALEKLRAALAPALAYD